VSGHQIESLGMATVERQERQVDGGRFCPPGLTTEETSIRSLSGPRVLMTTEGTYPYRPGGVTTWCNFLVEGLSDFRWQVLPITTGGRTDRSCPEWVEVLPSIEIWSGPPKGWRPPRAANVRGRASLPAELAAAVLGWNGDTGALLDALVWCRSNPHGIRAIFRARRGWESFLTALEAVLAERPPGVGESPGLSLSHVAMLYHAMYWIAHTAAVPTPPADILLVTAAGWSAIPALVHRALHGTPLLLIEHGVFVREAYLAAAKTNAASRFATTRLARGLTRAAYAGADVVNPVQEANAGWEEALGVPPERIHTIFNAMANTTEPTESPRVGRVVSLGRLDPLKDIHTLLRVAAEVTRQHPEVEFHHYGPYSWPPSSPYGESCRALHERLGLGSRFRFMGFAPDSVRVLQEADVVVMTSISEGFPMSILEAMAAARPVVTTWVGGIPGVVRGCGYIAPPGDTYALATAILTLVRNPELAAVLGLRGRARLTRKYSEDDCLGRYRRLLVDMAAKKRAA
jgi:glycosyltransferase involved in cell wall biosynthesis